MQPKTTLLDIAADPTSPAGMVSQAEIDRHLERAVALVVDFTETTALPALEACLASAAEAPKGLPLVPLAEELCQQTAMLQDEVERFLGHIESCRET